MQRFYRIISAVIGLLLVFFSTGCMETPTEDIIINKSEQGIEEIISSSSEANLDPNSEYASDFSFKTTDGKVTFNINTQTETPDFENIPILQVTPHYFTSAEIERIAKLLFTDNPIYEYTEILTKDQLQKMILEEKQSSPTKEYLLEYYNGDENLAESYLQIYADRIAVMEAAYQTAPDSSILIPSDFEYHPDTYYTTKTSNEYLNSSSIDGLMSVKLTSTIDGVPYFMWVSKRDDASYRTSSLYMYPYDITDRQHETEYYQTTELTDAEIEYAFEIVNSFLGEMDLGNWAIESHYFSSGDTPRGKTTHGIVFNCVPLFNNFPLLYGNVLGGYTEQYSPNFLNTYLSITVSNNRIMSVVFESPLDIVTEVDSDVPLLSYEDIFEKICSQLELTCSARNIRSKFFYETGIEVISASVNVTDITLSFVRTRIKDNDKDFYLVPAWTVYGYYVVHEIESDNKTMAVPSQDEEKSSMALFSINAIDGSVINLAQGY